MFVGSCQDSALWKWMVVFLVQLLLTDARDTEPELVRLPEDRITGLGCIPEGRNVSYQCTVVDTSSLGSTVWSGSAFQCPDSSNQINLRHGQFSELEMGGLPSCGTFRITSLRVNGSTYVSQLSLTATTELNGTTISCSFGNLAKEDVITVGAIPPPPGLPMVTIFSESSLNVSWSPPSGSVEGGVGGYVFSVTGEGCGCVSINVSSDTTSVTCSGWTAAGQNCSFEVKTLSGDCGLAGQTCFFEVKTLSQDCGLASDPVSSAIRLSACDPAELGDQPSSMSSSGTAVISNGVIEYDGVVVGSVANLVCNEGYTPGVNSSNRTCMNDGKWSGMNQTCAPSQPIPDLGNIVGITVGVTGIVCIGMIVFITILFQRIWRKKGDANPPGNTSDDANPPGDTSDDANPPGDTSDDANPPGDTSDDANPPGDTSDDANPPGDTSDDANPPGDTSDDANPPGDTSDDANPPGDTSDDANPPGDTSDDANPPGDTSDDANPPGDTSDDDIHSGDTSDDDIHSADNSPSTGVSSSITFNWRKYKDRPQDIEKVTLPVALNGEIYAKGFVKSDRGESTQIVLKYTPSQDQWHKLPPPPVNNFVIATLKGQLLVLGGQDKSTQKITNTIFTFNESSNKWDKTLFAMPMTDLLPGVQGYHDHLIVFGWESAKVNFLDTAAVSNGWKTAQPLPKTEHNYTVLIKDTMYLVGTTSRTVLRAYIPTLISQTGAESGVWETLPNTPYYSSVPITFANTLFTVGGYCSEDILDSIPETGIQMFDSTTKRWTKIGDLPEPFDPFGVVIDSKLFVFATHKSRAVYASDLTMS